VIFAFGGCALFAPPTTRCNAPTTRRCSARASLPSLLGLAVGHRAGRPVAALGFTQGKEYAELEWPIDLLITVVWVSYAIVFFGTVMKRKTPHIYVSNWFLRRLHPDRCPVAPLNSAAIPVFAMGWLTPKSYSAYAGVQTHDPVVVRPTMPSASS